MQWRHFLKQGFLKLSLSSGGYQDLSDRSPNQDGGSSFGGTGGESWGGDGRGAREQGEGRKGSEDWGNGWGEEGGWSGEASPQKEPEK